MLLFINGEVRPVKSQSISEIVRAFIEAKKPGHALAALGMILLAIVVITLVPMIGAMIKLVG
jgi:hypothetical protein